MAFYVICDDDSKHESMTKEQILAAIAQAMETGKIGNCDTGFVTKIKEKNTGNYVSFWVGSRAQYNAIETKETNCMYIINDETFGEYIPIKTSHDGKSVVRFYGDGIAEGWYRIGHRNATFTEEKNGLYTNKNPVTLDYAYFPEYTNNHIEEMPIVSEVTLCGVENNADNIPLLLLPVTYATSEHAGKYYVASTEPIEEELHVKISLHMIWRWK